MNVCISAVAYLERCELDEEKPVAKGGLRQALVSSGNE